MIDSSTEAAAAVAAVVVAAAVGETLASVAGIAVLASGLAGSVLTRLGSRSSGGMTGSGTAVVGACTFSYLHFGFALQAYFPLMALQSTGD